MRTPAGVACLPHPPSCSSAPASGHGQPHASVARAFAKLLGNVMRFDLRHVVNHEDLLNAVRCGPTVKQQPASGKGHSPLVSLFSPQLSYPCRPRCASGSRAC